jgi:hypothetical protein
MACEPHADEPGDRAMRRVTLAAFLLLSACAAKNPVGEGHVWQGTRSFEPLSTTATSITGPIAFAPGTLTFDGTKSVGIESLGVRQGAWGDDGGDAAAEVFRMASDPGALRNGNTLCGGVARYAVFYEDDTFGPAVGALFFSSEEPPRDAGSAGLCGTFSYAID